jgi:hypothetical protein
MTQLSDANKSLLNEFTKSQPALQDPKKPYPESSLKLGDLLDNLSASTTVKATYDFSKNGGAVGTIGLGVTLPAGAIVTGLWTDAETALASGGLAEVALEAGSTTLKAAAAFDDVSYIGVDAQSLTPVKLSAASELEVVITVAALTAGKLNIFVEYLK